MLSRCLISILRRKKQHQFMSIWPVIISNLLYTKNAGFVESLSLPPSLHMPMYQTSVRHYGSKRIEKYRIKKVNSYEEDSSDRNEESDSDDSDIEEFPEDEVTGDRLPKKMTTVLPGLRVDSVAARCFNESRNEMESQFYAGHLYLNGNVVTKKNTVISEGDYLDLCHKKNGKVMARRVRLLKIKGTVTKQNKIKTQVSILLWKSPFDVPDDYYQRKRS